MHRGCKGPHSLLLGPHQLGPPHLPLHWGWNVYRGKGPFRHFSPGYHPFIQVLWKASKRLIGDFFLCLSNFIKMFIEAGMYLRRVRPPGFIFRGGGTTLSLKWGVLPWGSIIYFYRRTGGWVPPSSKTPYFWFWSYVPFSYYPAPPPCLEYLLKPKTMHLDLGSNCL